MQELAEHILDIAENSIAAFADTIQIRIVDNWVEQRMSISIIDNGVGMDPEAAKVVTSPFFTTRTERGVGLGLSLFQLRCWLTGGDLYLDSFPGQGTTVYATLYTDSYNINILIFFIQAC